MTTRSILRRLGQPLLCAAALLALSGSALAQPTTYTWVPGAVGGNSLWSNSANWDLGSPPPSGTVPATTATDSSLVFPGGTAGTTIATVNDIVQPFRLVGLT